MKDTKKELINAIKECLTYAHKAKNKADRKRWVERAWRWAELLSAYMDYQEVRTLFNQLRQEVLDNKKK